MKVFKYNFQTLGLKPKQEDYLYTTSSDEYKFQLGVVADGVSNSVNPLENVIPQFMSSIDGHFNTPDSNNTKNMSGISKSLKNYYKLNHNYSSIFPKIVNVPYDWPRTLRDDYENHLYNIFENFLVDVKTFIWEIVNSDSSKKNTTQRNEYFSRIWKTILGWINSEFDFMRLIDYNDKIILEWKISSLDFDTYFEIIKKILTVRKIQEWWNSEKNTISAWDYPFYYSYGAGDRLETKIISESTTANKIKDNTHMTISTLDKLTPELFDIRFKEWVLTKPFGGFKFTNLDRSSLTFGFAMIKYGNVWLAGVGDVQMYSSSMTNNNKFKTGTKLNKIFIDDSINQKEYGGSTITYDEFYKKNKKFSSGITASFSNTDETFDHIKTKVEKLSDINSLIIMSDGCLSKDINRWTLDKVINKIKVKNNGIHPFLQIVEKLNKLRGKHLKYIKNNFKHLLNNDINTLIYFDEDYEYSIDMKMIKEYVEVDRFIKTNTEEWTHDDIMWIKMMYMSYMIYINRNDNATFYFIKLDKHSSLYDTQIKNTQK